MNKFRNGEIRQRATMPNAMNEVTSILYDFGRINKGMEYLKAGKSDEEVIKVFGKKHGERIIRFYDQVKQGLACIVQRTPAEMGLIFDNKVTAKGEIELLTGCFYGLHEAALLSNKPLYVRKYKFNTEDLGLELTKDVTGLVAQAIAGQNKAENMMKTVKILITALYKKENLDDLEQDWQQANMEQEQNTLFPVIEQALAIKAGIMYGLYNEAADLEYEITDEANLKDIADTSESVIILDRMIEANINASFPQEKRRVFMYNLLKVRHVLDNINPQDFWDQMVMPVLEFFTNKNKVYGFDNDFVTLDKTEEEKQIERDEFPYEQVLIKSQAVKIKHSAIMKDRGNDSYGKWLGRDIIKTERRVYSDKIYYNPAIEEVDFTVDADFDKQDAWKSWRTRVGLNLNKSGIHYLDRADYMRHCARAAEQLVKARYLRETGKDWADKENAWDFKVFAQRQLRNYQTSKEEVMPKVAC